MSDQLGRILGFVIFRNMFLLVILFNQTLYIHKAFLMFHIIFISSDFLTVLEPARLGFLLELVLEFDLGDGIDREVSLNIYVLCFV